MTSPDTTPEATPDTTETNPEPANDTPGSEVDDLARLDPATLAAMVRDLRKENGAARTNAKQTAADEARQQLARDIGRALGLVDDDAPADPAALAEQLTAERDAQTTAARTAAVELAIYKTAAKHGADPDALTDSRAFTSTVDALDPSADDFAAQLDEAIRTAVADHPKLSATGQAPPARSAAQHTGGTGAQATPRTLTDAVAARYGRA